MNYNTKNKHEKAQCLSLCSPRRYSGSHPADILIGTVIKTRLDNVGLLQEADVHAAADVADVEHVLVITSFTPAPKIEFNRQGGQAK